MLILRGSVVTIAVTHTRIQTHTHTLKNADFLFILMPTADTAVGCLFKALVGYILGAALANGERSSPFNSPAEYC